jgi:hypothetical protein
MSMSNNGTFWPGISFFFAMSFSLRWKAAAAYLTAPDGYRST